VSVPGRCIPMSNLGRANPGNREQFNRLCILYDVRRSQTLVDIRHRCNVHMSRDLLHRKEVGVMVPVRKGRMSKPRLFGLYTCHQREKWELQAQSAENINTVDYFLRVL